MQLPTTWLASEGRGVVVAVIACSSYAWVNKESLLAVNLLTDAATCEHETLLQPILHTLLALAPACRLLWGQVSRSQGVWSEMSQAAAALHWAIDHGARVVFMPAHSDWEQLSSLDAALKRAAKTGVLVMTTLEQLPPAWVVERNKIRQPLNEYRRYIGQLLAAAVLALSKHQQKQGKTPIQNLDDLRRHLVFAIK